MGFFDSFVEGAKSAGGWALDHAGDIATVVSTVAKVAGFVVLDSSGTPDHQSHLADFHTNFKVVCTKLLQHAQQGVKSLGPKAERDLDADEFAAEDKVLDSVTGIWTDPAPLSKDGIPAIPMYQDLSKWLATLGVPSSADGVDAAARVAQAIFVETDDDAANAVEDDPIKTMPFTLSIPGSWSLDVAHAYYGLPLGASTDDHSWHSCVYAEFHPSKSHVLGKRQRMHATTGIDKITTGVPTWMINATIIWGSVATAFEVTDPFLTKCKEIFKDSGDRGVVSHNLLGVSLSVQVQANQNHNPSIVKSLLNGGAAKILSDKVTSQSIDNNDWENRDINLADGTDAIHDDTSTRTGKEHTANGRANKDRVAKPPRKPTDLVPPVMPRFTVTSSQMIFLPGKE